MRAKSAYYSSLAQCCACYAFYPGIEHNKKYNLCPVCKGLRNSVQRFQEYYN